MLKLTNPIVLAVVLLGLLAIGIIVGVKWDTWFPKKKKNGNGSAGAGGGSTTRAVTPAIVERIVSPIIVPIGTMPPATILLPSSAACYQYTYQNPYSYQGCSYVFGGYVFLKGRRWCLLKRTRCS